MGPGGGREVRPREAEHRNHTHPLLRIREEEEVKKLGDGGGIGLWRGEYYDGQIHLRKEDGQAQDEQCLLSPRPRRGATASSTVYGSVAAVYSLLGAPSFALLGAHTQPPRTAPLHSGRANPWTGALCSSRASLTPLYMREHYAVTH
jgi:hypothetical protein